MLVGLVGKPSVGKSTFFKAATLAEVDIAAYPFTTIKPNHGVGYVRIPCIDQEFHTQCHPNHGFCIQHQRFVPIDLLDVAGLVPGASEGKGLGNQFLDDLRAADVLLHIVDASGTTDVEGKATENYDPTQDVLFLEKELNQWFYQILAKVWKSFVRKTEMEDANFAQAIAQQFSGLKVTEDEVKDVLRDVRFSGKPTMWGDALVFEFASALRAHAKPMIIAANKVDAPNGFSNVAKLTKTFPHLLIIPCSADSELALRQASKQGLISYIPGDTTFSVLKELSPKQQEALDRIRVSVLEKFPFGTGVQHVLNTAVFDFLKYVAIFPASATKLGDSKGHILPDCFLLPPRSTALDFAYYLHTDFGKNFIKAIDARSKLPRGKEYLLKHRDALEIVTR